MRIANILKADIANGTGFRVTLFVQGCPIHCNGCFNHETWNPEGGRPWTDEEKAKIFKELQHEWCSGLSILGGEPLAPYNLPDVMQLCVDVKKTFPDKNIWLWSGYEFEAICKDERKEVLKYLDVIVVGPFVEELKDTSLLWRGSSNQRIITLKNGNAQKVE